MSHLRDVVFIQIADKTVANTTTETSLVGTGATNSITTFPANYFKVGSDLSFNLRGFYSRTLGNVTFRFKLGSTTILANVAASPGGASNDGFEIDLTLTCRTIGATGTITGQGKYITLSGNQFLQMIALTPVVIDTTVALTWDFTIQMGSLSVGNSFTSTNSILQKKNII